LITIPNDQEREILLSERVARMATADGSGRPHVVPICFAYDGHNIFTPLDKKPKRVPAGELRRVRNILSNPRVSLVVDGYYEDWKRLYYVLIYAQRIRAEKHRNSLYSSVRNTGNIEKWDSRAGFLSSKSFESIVSWGTRPHYAPRYEYRTNETNPTSL
jgi:PPOX class probable F420-dependent enzyme